MKLKKEPKEVDFIIKSKPWSKKDAAEFSLLIKEIKQKNTRRKISAAKSSDSENSAPARKRVS